jgi:hypothetical protein
MCNMALPLYLTVQSRPLPAVNDKAAVPVKFEQSK